VLSAHLYVVYAVCSVFGACCLVLGLKQLKIIVIDIIIIYIIIRYYVVLLLVVIVLLMY
jgi:hypothetical protein